LETTSRLPRSSGALSEWGLINKKRYKSQKLYPLLPYVTGQSVAAASRDGRARNAAFTLIQLYL